MGNKQTLPQIPQPQQEQPAAADDENHEFTCEICIEPKSISDKKFRNTHKCSHPFCNDCIIKNIRFKLEDNVGNIKCPALNCNHRLDTPTCAPIVGPPLFVRWCDVLCEAAIVGLDKCYCPYRDCNILIVNECGGNVRKSSCPKCQRWFCFECKEVWHAGFGCAESRVLIRDENDEAFGRLVEENKWPRCPSCRHFVERVAGCDIMLCRCGMNFCYECGNRVNRHWCEKCGKNRYCVGIFSVLIFIVIIAFFIMTIGLCFRVLIMSKQIFYFVFNF